MIYIKINNLKSKLKHSYIDLINVVIVTLFNNFHRTMLLYHHLKYMFYYHSMTNLSYLFLMNIVNVYHFLFNSFNYMLIFN